MLNYVIDPTLLQPLVPAGTELDSFEGRTFVSVVGFQFRRTRLFGVPIPWHRNFEEVNLRFYVRRKADDGWRRGVVFVRELVPRRAIALVARTCYGEPYVALPMRHRVTHDAADAGVDVEYAWERNGRWESLRAKASGAAQPIVDNSEEEFIAEHYWGYTARSASARGGCATTGEYQVEHPRWRIWRCHHATLDADVRGLYGQRFVECLSQRPTSAFIADGSAITVRCGTRLANPVGSSATGPNVPTAAAPPSGRSEP